MSVVGQSHPNVQVRRVSSWRNSRAVAVDGNVPRIWTIAMGIAAGDHWPDEGKNGNCGWNALLFCGVEAFVAGEGTLPTGCAGVDSRKRGIRAEKRDRIGYCT